MNKLLIFFLILIIIICELLFLHFVCPDMLTKHLYSLLIINAMAFLILALIDPFYILICSFLLLPFNLYKPLNFELGAAHFSVFSLSILALCAYLFFSIIAGRKAYKIKTPDVMIILLSIVYGISLYNSPDILKSGFVIFHTFFMPAATYFVIKNMIDTQKRFDISFYSLSISVVMMACLGIAMFIKTGKRIEVLDMPAIGTAILFSYLSFSLMYSKYFRKKSFFFAIALPICLIATLLSMTRVVLLLVFLSPFIMSLFKRGYARKIIIIFLPLSFLLSTVPPFFIQMNKKEVSTNASSVERSERKTIKRITTLNYYIHNIKGRLFLIKSGLLKFTEKPILGHGAEGVATSGWHNLYTELLYWTGILGLSFYLIIFLYPFWVDIEGVYHKDLYLTNLFMVFVLMTNSLTNGYHGFAPVFIFISLAMCEVLKVIKPERTESHRPKGLIPISYGSELLPDLKGPFIYFHTENQ